MACSPNPPTLTLFRWITFTTELSNEGYQRKSFLIALPVFPLKVKAKVRGKRQRALGAQSSGTGPRWRRVATRHDQLAELPRLQQSVSCFVTQPNNLAMSVQPNARGATCIHVTASGRRPACFLGLEN
jgi:hypothetical protein